MCIKLELEKVIVQGVKSFKVLAVKALYRHSVGVDTEARHEYLTGFPRAFAFGSKELLVLSQRTNDPHEQNTVLDWREGSDPELVKVTHVQPGDVLSVTAMTSLRKDLKEAGQRLAEINERRREQWSGREVIEI